MTMLQYQGSVNGLTIAGLCNGTIAGGCGVGTIKVLMTFTLGESYIPLYVNFLGELVFRGVGT